MPLTPDPQRPLKSDDPDVVQAALDALEMTDRDEAEIERYRRDLERRFLELDAAGGPSRLAGGSSPEALAAAVPRQ